VAVHSGVFQKCQTTMCVPSITVTYGQDADGQKYIHSSAISAQRKKHTKVTMFEQAFNVLTLWENNEAMWWCPYYWITWNTTSHHLQSAANITARHAALYHLWVSQPQQARPTNMYSTEACKAHGYTGKSCKYHWRLWILPSWSQSNIHGWCRN